MTLYVREHRGHFDEEGRFVEELHARATPARFPMVGVADDDVVYLETLVPVMRHLGVISHGTTVLGPDPSTTAPSDEPNLSPGERRLQAQKAEEERLHRLRFGASGGPRPLGYQQR